VKAFIVTVVLAAFSSLGATILSPSFASESGAAAAEGRQLFEQEVSMYAQERGPLDGAPGASCVSFRVSDSVQGAALIVGLDQPVLGVFVGLNTPNKHINAPYQDLSVTFTLTDGSTHTVKPDAGSGTAMLFKSPGGVPMTSLRSVALFVDKTAKWAK